MVYHFYIELQESDPLVWRRIVVPADFTFYQLHKAIQGAFGWENSHLFQFSESGFSDKTSYGFPGEDIDPDTETIDARKTKMSQILKKEGQTYCYIYDFGDEWEHRLTLEKIEAKDTTAPYCLDGAGACPPEDVGGMHGYQEMLAVLKKKPPSGKSRLYRMAGLGRRRKMGCEILQYKRSKQKAGATGKMI